MFGEINYAYISFRKQEKTQTVKRDQRKWEDEDGVKMESAIAFTMKNLLIRSM